MAQFEDQKYLGSKVERYQTLAAEGSSEPELHAEKYRNRSGSKTYLRGGFLAET